MSKKSRHADNSKRPQPIQQQRAQARTPGPGGPSKADNSGQQQGKQRKEDTAEDRKG